MLAYYAKLNVESFVFFSLSFVHFSKWISAVLS